MAPLLSSLGGPSVPLLLILHTSVAVVVAAVQHGPVRGLSFVQRRGSQLLVDGQPARFAGANAYWLGLDENVLINGSKLHYPTHFRVDDAFETAAGMGALVIRAHTVGVSTGHSLSFEPRLGVFAEGEGLASDHIDYAIYRAGISGIRLIVPLTDNYAYFHGGNDMPGSSDCAACVLLTIRVCHVGKHDFVDWVDPEMEYRANCVLPLCVKEPAARLCPFYTDPRVIGGFKQYIKALLNHVNRYTGVALKEDPAIMGWETGKCVRPSFYCVPSLCNHETARAALDSCENLCCCCMLRQRRRRRL
jgi:hypothetical protein